MDPATVRVWIDDSHAVFRRGLASCLHADGFTIAGESSGFLPSPDLTRTQVLLFDIAEASSLSHAVRLVRGTDVQLVGIAQTVSEQLLFDALEAGLGGFLLRPELTPDKLVNAIRTVASGHGSVPRGLVARLLEELAKGGPRGTSPGGLSSRELRVLGLLASGESTKEVAHQLSYSERTVKNIIHDTLMKMNCRTRAHAVALATRQGVI